MEHVSELIHQSNCKNHEVYVPTCHLCVRVYYANLILGKYVSKYRYDAALTEIKNLNEKLKSYEVQIAHLTREE